MAIEIKVPSLGDGVESADVLEVLVSEGEVIELEQGIVELETDKATAVVPSTQAGKVTKIHVGEGDTVPVGAVLISVEGSAAPEAAPPKTEPPKAAAPAPEPPKPEPPKPAPVEPAPAPAAEAAPPAPAAPPTPAAPAPAAPPANTGAVNTGNGNEIAAGPAMRRFAREVGVDLGQVSGTGEGGRINREDILRVVRSGGARSVPGGSGERDEFGSVRTEKLSRMRRTIADQMHKSWSTVPRVTNFDDADVTDLDNIRKSSKADYAARGIKLTSMPFVIKAVAMALKAHPVINA